MRLLIDGYNLMYDAGFTDQLRAERGLSRCRAALLRFIATVLSPAEAAETYIIFDAANPPPGLPKFVDFDGLQVHFAKDHADADEMMEELIQSHSAPKSLTVVSSDHRLHKAASRRKAKPIDSGLWYEEIKRRGKQCGFPPPKIPRKPQPSQTKVEIDEWTELFSDEKLQQIIREETAADSPLSKPAKGKTRTRQSNSTKGNQKQQTNESKSSSKVKKKRPTKRSEKPTGKNAQNPFPPGYADDVDFEP